jgi:predicted lipoprotein with Yx(FWY)xxD motif
MKISHFFAALAFSAASMTVCVSAIAADAPAKLEGGVLVAANGMTLYTFDNDKAGSGKSACNGPCAVAWPPLLATAADQPSGNFSVVTRDDGAKQLAYKGKPLYFYQADKKAGDRTGDNFKNIWHTVKE